MLSIGVPWNAIDREGLCAGDYAIKNSHEDIIEVLITAGVQAELILGAVERNNTSRSFQEQSFLNQQLIFKEDCILDKDNEAVMMKWEAPLMEAHAEALSPSGGHVLNVGFGMGLIDEAIQRRNPQSHTIIEAHPQIVNKMRMDGWDRRPGVKILQGRWQDVIHECSGFDSVFFDTYGEHYSDLQDFHRHLPRLLKPGGVYSFFNGLAPDNAFFHLVYCEIVKLELKGLGLTVQFVSLPLNVQNEDIWKSVRRRYWWNNVYYLPFAQKDTEEENKAKDESV